jgi:hypothetical protein
MFIPLKKDKLSKPSDKFSSNKMCLFLSILLICIILNTPVQIKHVKDRNLYLKHKSELRIQRKMLSMYQVTTTLVLDIRKVPSNRVISSPFSHRTFFLVKFREGTPYFLSGRKFMKKVLQILAWSSLAWANI